MITLDSAKIKLGGLLSSDFETVLDEAVTATVVPVYITRSSGFYEIEFFGTYSGVTALKTALGI